MIVYLWLLLGAALQGLWLILGRTAFAIEIAAEGALWTLVIGFAFIAPIEFLGWVGPFCARARSVDGRP